MKKLLLFSTFVLFYFCGQSQLLKKITDRAKNNADSKVNNAVNKTVDDAMNGKKDEKKNAEAKDTATAPIVGNSQPVSFKTYSKYDFVPGEKVIGFEDFSTGNIGDFPAGWNTNASGEIVSIEGKPGRWLWLTKPGVFVPEFAQEYPDDFTLEFDLMHGVPINGAYFIVGVAELSDRSNISGWIYETNNFSIELDNANTGT